MSLATAPAVTAEGDCDVTEDERDVLREHLASLSMSDDEAAARLRAVRVTLRSRVHLAVK